MLVTDSVFGWNCAATKPLQSLMACLWSSDASQQEGACVNNYILFSIPTSQHDPKNYACFTKKKKKNQKEKKKKKKVKPPEK